MTKEEKKEYRKQWYIKNKDRLKQSQNSQTKEKIKQYMISYNKEYKDSHKTEITEYNSQYYIDNKESAKKRARSHFLKRNYGITQEQVDQMHKEQSGLCALCFKPPGKTGLVVDHCHKSGKVRALLCQSCNARLGVVEDIEFNKIAIFYLTKYKI